MGLETASFLAGLVPTNPDGTDGIKQGDNHLRLLKSVLQNTFPSLSFSVSFNATTKTLVEAANMAAVRALLDAPILTGDNEFLSTDAGATAGPVVSGYRNSPSAADGDLGFKIQFEGNDDNASPVKKVYSYIQSVLLDTATAGVSGALDIYNMVAGASTFCLRLAQGVVVGPATGGDQGVGTVNVSAGYYLNGVAMPTAQSKSVPVRQTVLSGPVDSDGLPSFGGATGSTTVTASGTLVVTAANGADINGAVNRVGSIANPAWTGLSVNGTMYLYLDIDAAGVCTAGAGTLAPVYQWGGTYSTTSGQFTFNIQEMVGKVGNGVSADQTYRVYVGQVTVALNVVSAITWYAIQGRYVSAFTSTLPGTSSTAAFTHNIGTTVGLSFPILILKNLTTQASYVAGDLVYLPTTSGSGFAAQTPTVSALTMAFPTGQTVAFAVYTKGGGASTNLTAANWSYAGQIKRDW